MGHYTQAERLLQVHGARGEDPTEPSASAPTRSRRSPNVTLLTNAEAVLLDTNLAGTDGVGQVIPVILVSCPRMITIDGGEPALPRHPRRPMLPHQASRATRKPMLPVELSGVLELRAPTR
jgi:hypothetical protein